MYSSRTTSVYDWLPENGPPFAADVLSVAVMVKSNEPVAVGVPESSPVVVLNVRPGGTEPLIA